MPVSGRQTNAGMNVGTGTWGTGAPTEIAVGAGDGLYLRGDPQFRMARMQQVDDSAGLDFHRNIQAGLDAPVTGTVQQYCHFDDVFLNPWWALAFGAGDTTPNLVSGESAVWEGTFTPSVSKAAVYGTFVHDKSQQIHVVPGFKVTGFELRSADNGRLELDFMCVGSQQIEDSTTNTSTEVAALTYPTVGLRAFINQCVWRINGQGTSALDSSDADPFSAFTLRYSQPLDTIHVGGQTVITEPMESEFPTVEIEFTLRNYNADAQTWFAGHRTETEYKMDLTITGPNIGVVPSQRKLTFSFPKVVPMSPEYPVDGANQIAPKVMFKALDVASAPLGMTGITTPIHLATIGGRSANPFA